LYQGREDLTVNFMLDYSGIQIEAGDVIRITSAVYGWDALSGFPDGKLFRVIQVQEAKLAEGSLGANIVASEYNDTVYVDNVIYDYIPADNTGLADPAIIGTPAAPTITTTAITAGNVASFWVLATVPTVGQVLYMDFFYGNSSDPTTHKLYRTETTNPGSAWTPGATTYINVNDLYAGTWYWSIRARNNIAAKHGASSAPYVWVGPSVTDVYEGTLDGWSSSGATFTGPDTTGMLAGMHVRVVFGVGVVAASAKISNILSTTQFTMDSAPSVALSSSGISVYIGGIDSRNITSWSVDTNKITPYNPITGTGGLNYYALNPSTINISRSIGGTNFAVSNTALPVSVLSTTTRNIPIYIPGTNVGATRYYPYFQGTATLGMFYAAASTSAMAPPNSRTLVITDSDDDGLGGVWYVLVYDLFAAGTMSAQETYRANFGITLVSDADATIQVVGGIGTTGFTYFECDTEKLQTYYLKANLPIVIPFSQTFTDSLGGASLLIAGGCFCRNMTAGSNVSLISASLASTAIINPYA